MTNFIKNNDGTYTDGRFTIRKLRAGEGYSSKDKWAAWDSKRQDVLYASTLGGVKRAASNRLFHESRRTV